MPRLILISYSRSHVHRYWRRISHKRRLKPGTVNSKKRFKRLSIYRSLHDLILKKCTKNRLDALATTTCHSRIAFC
jgi:hypothetical protein